MLTYVSKKVLSTVNLFKKYIFNYFNVGYYSEIVCNITSFKILVIIYLKTKTIIICITISNVDSC